MSDRNGWRQEYLKLDSIVDKFLASLPTMDSVSESANKELVRGLLAVHTFARSATIEIDVGLQGLNSVRNEKDLAAAKHIAIAVLRSKAQELRYVDPILAVRFYYFLKPGHKPTLVY